MIFGRRQKQIAEVLGITPDTVKSHKAQILRKLGVYSSEEAVFRGVDCGFVNLSLCSENLDVGRVKSLTPRQKEVLGVFTDITSFPGGTKGTARRLRIADQTIKNTLGEIFTRLNVDNRTQAGLMFMAAQRDGKLNK